MGSPKRKIDVRNSIREVSLGYTFSRTKQNMFVDRSNSLVRESLTLKMKFASNYQLRKGQLRSWLKLRQHERLENEDSFTEENTPEETKHKESTSLIDLNVSNTE